ncbi:hypothetical protein [Dyella koreensis]|uniref:Uncharacterized protein n=1 Tax=Dyella koreensis TaxID=311235 RepID=A0ABW8K9X4_9GAMM
MTNTSLSLARRIAQPLLGVSLLLSAGAVMAWQQQRPPTSQPPTMSASAIQAQQANQQALLMDQVQKNQVQEEQRQRNAAAIRRPFANDKAATGALDSSDQAQRDQYNARQQDLLNRYRAASAVNPVVLPQAAPAKKKVESQGAGQQPAR